MIVRISLGELEDVVPLFDAYRVFYKQDSDLRRARQFLQARLSKEESVLFAAYQNGRAIGFTQLYPTYSSMRTAKNWILNDLYVDLPQRRQGIGAQLIEAAAQFAKEEGATFLRLSTQIQNTTAQSLYVKTGFGIEDPDTEFLTYKRTAL
ncbi:GNAT family N-acetyltransferase [Sphingobacterium griseoflavum]|uniref:N-acetyltransferase n=1 Tax=Sphingobacterium griseoflavum TaxID=1474952 RepID=A0ABQ3HXW7_9SPHI|nr:GNAT family N-acetyltransferase [Sphingobacterium griseoflavum]GHE38332.1 N-acetyltransferase [Sphingobacterium griseoflavum]